MSSSAPVIQVSDVTIVQNGIVVLDSVSLTVERGHFTALIGPNGAGKTTLVKAILGLIKPDRGHIEVLGRPAQRLGADRARIGYVPQIFNIDLNFPITVFETVLMGTYGKIGIGKRPGEGELAAASAAIEKVGITDLQSRPLAGCPAARGSGLSLLAPWRTVPSCCFSTNPPREWTWRQPGVSIVSYTS